MMQRLAWACGRWGLPRYSATDPVARHRHFSSANKDGPTVASSALTRNVGIMAHIDAGKTTTTERMLYYTGVTRKLGDVDDGSTVMDYMKLERERGITINAAAITFNWKQHRINLIDTPGHVDFTFEVERSLKVLDGAVALFDGSAGVEAQTVAVWRQADTHGVPRIAFVNKMDKPAASLSYTVDTMKKKLHTTPLVVQLPLGQGKDFCGMVELVTMDILAWAPGSDGSEYSRSPLVPSSGETEADFRSLSKPSEEPPGLLLSKRLWEEILQARSLLAEQVLTLDDQLLDDQLLKDSFSPITLPPAKLREGIRRLTLGCHGVPVFCGSSLKNKGIQPLLDGVIQYLPAPNERNHGIPSELSELCAYAFKVVHDPQRGALVYLRVYTGAVRTHRGLYNFSRGKEEKITRLFVVLADELVEVTSMAEGNIVAAVGLKNTITGDVLVQSAAAAKAVRKGLESKGGVAEAPAVLQGLRVPEPAFFCTIEPATAAQQADLDHALHCLSREDPSLRVSVDPDTRQVVLSGMGELHLEIVHDRIQRDYHVQASLGTLRVAYREAPTLSVTYSGSLDRSLGNKRQFVSLSVAITPVDNGQLPQIQLSPLVSVPSWTTASDVLEAFRGGVEIACGQGPLLGFPIRNVQVELVALVLGAGTSMAMMSACVSETVSKALRKTGVHLLEPFSQLVVTVPEEHLGTVLSDLTSARRGVVNEVASHDETATVTAHIPTASLMGYSTALRSITSGSGSFVSLFSCYEPVSRTLEKTITEQLRGYV